MTDGDFHTTALEVLCRVFPDGADEAMEEWRAWYKPGAWMHPARALGAFIFRRLLATRQLTGWEREGLDELRAAQQRASKEQAATGRVAVTITMSAANALCHAIITSGPGPVVGLPPDESPARDAVCNALVAELLSVGHTASGAGERTTVNLCDENELRGLARFLTARDGRGRDGPFGERRRIFWETLGRILSQHAYGEGRAMKASISQSELLRLQEISARAAVIRQEQEALQDEVEELLDTVDPEDDGGLTERDDVMWDFIANGKPADELLSELEIRVEGA